MIHPRKLTCPLRREYFNRKYIFQPWIFRGHVSFPGSTLPKNPRTFSRKKTPSQKGRWVHLPTRDLVVVAARMHALSCIRTLRLGYHGCLVYSPTWMVDFYGKCRSIYQSQGSYGSEIRIPWDLRSRWLEKHCFSRDFSRGPWVAVSRFFFKQLTASKKKRARNQQGGPLLVISYKGHNSTYIGAK